jgi:hypothetical protein
MSLRLQKMLNKLTTEFCKDFPQRAAVFFHAAVAAGALFLAKALHAAKDQSFAAQRILGRKTKPRSIF